MSVVRRFTLGVAFALFPSFAHAQTDGFKLSGAFRLRYEAIDGQARTGFDSEDTLLNLRSQIRADYGTGPVHIVAELFDSRAWGADPGTPLTTGEVNTFEPVQAYIAADLGSVFGKGTKTSLTAGRFMLNLGSRRLVAADDYRNTTNGYTGVRADFSAPGSIKATFIYTLPQARRPDDAASLRDQSAELDKESLDAVLWGGLASKAKVAGAATAELSFFHLGERDAPGRPTRDRSLNTLGGRLHVEPKPGNIDYEFEAFYQFGRIGTSTAATAAPQDVSATFVHARIGYTLPTSWSPRLSFEYDRASGDNPGGSFGRFDTYYGMRRADLAPAGLYNAIGRANISAVGLRLEAAPTKKLDWFVAYRPMWLASSTDAFSTSGVRDATGAAGDFAGHQIEGRVRLWLIPNRLRYEINALVLAKGRFLREAPNAPSGDLTRYASFSLTASL
jgi:hypothetical protein